MVELSPTKSVLDTIQMLEDSDDEKDEDEENRNRQYFAEYYGLNKTEDERKAQADVYNLDGPSFSVAKKFEQLITTKTLPQLMDYDNELVVGKF